MAKGIEPSHVCDDMNLGLWIDFPVQNYANVLSFRKLGIALLRKLQRRPAEISAGLSF